MNSKIKKNLVKLFKKYEPTNNYIYVFKNKIYFIIENFKIMIKVKNLNNGLYEISYKGSINLINHNKCDNYKCKICKKIEMLENIKNSFNNINELFNNTDNMLVYTSFNYFNNRIEFAKLVLRLKNYFDELFNFYKSNKENHDLFFYLIDIVSILSNNKNIITVQKKSIDNKLYNKITIGNNKITIIWKN